ncbi:FAD-dependent oxidoreductase [Rhodoplanes sp. Z2-YC6860]|uniref:FAD-dependent oxidoreductase n=1 Tax=Rhodoplanes sp. Z2-YC6860 TaxID=674703 RepID=UPI00078C429E|nr:FAD-dependent oxidoreductase [Rhodoplanes sp. Z2-YC6860]AMN38642.1 FAD dependent oxidoreductase [Rhodoplanes sp. Z2-YC6860]
MTIAVLGGGFQGCCIALALADRGQSVVIFERNQVVLSRTAIANEGKVHLGWMYAADPSLATARMMMEGALAFAPFLHRYLGLPIESLATSEPASYVVHRDSQHTAAKVREYFAAVHRLIVDASNGRQGAYFGSDLTVSPREWSAQERASVFDPAIAVAAFDTPEIAIDPVALAQHVQRALTSHPRIELRCAHEVLGVSEEATGVVVKTSGAHGQKLERFDHAVNALWEGRLSVDETAGLRPGRPWLHRLKYGVGFSWPDRLPRPPSATFVSGPFGEIVSYPDKTTYLTWYPTCVKAMSSDLVPPRWSTHPPEPLRSEIVHGTIQALSKFVRALAPVDATELKDVWVKGGAIVAWGETDIDDPESELHRRYEIGVHTRSRYHSVDPGKLTMAPYFADKCADRIVAGI